MKSIHVLAAINIVIWGGLSYMGFGLIDSVVDQHVAGYPNSGQITYYIHIPVIMAVSVLIAYALSWFRRFLAVFRFAQIVLLLAFFPFIMSYTGGV